VAEELGWLGLKFQRKLTQILCSRIYRDTNSDIRKSMIIAGAGRSGTTWLANIVASQLPCRIMWEPFNPHAIEAFSQFSDFLYKRAADPDPALYAYASDVLKGTIDHKWIDREISRVCVEYRIVKEIRANLFLNWLHKSFPDVPLLVIVRHPCAVVLSRMEANWGASADLGAMLSQPELVADLLNEKMDIIKHARSKEAKHAVLWSIQHLVPIKQFHAEQLGVVFYENLCLQPEVEIPRIFRILGHEYRDSVFNQVEKPSRTTLRSSAFRSGEDRVMRWRNRLSQTQTQDILSVVRDFDLDYIYGDSATPLAQAFQVHHCAD
jgi:hypothetical protein